MAISLAIAAKTREITGKKVGGIRKAGNVPAVLYGHKVKENLLLSVNKKEFEKMFKEAGESTLVKLNLEAGSPRTVLVHDVQHDVLTGTVTHVDFYEVDMTEKITTHIALEFIGESTAVKDLGGTLTKNMTEVEIEALPGDLPHSFVVDINNLKTFDDTVTLADLGVDGSKIRLINNPDTIIAKVTPPRSEEELASLDEQVEENVESVEGVEKKEDEKDSEEGKDDGDKEEAKEEKKEEPKKE